MPPYSISIRIASGFTLRGRLCVCHEVLRAGEDEAESSAHVVLIGRVDNKQRAMVWSEMCGANLDRK